MPPTAMGITESMQSARASSLATPPTETSPTSAPTALVRWPTTPSRNSSPRDTPRLVLALSLGLAPATVLCGPPGHFQRMKNIGHHRQFLSAILETLSRNQLLCRLHGLDCHNLCVYVGSTLDQQLGLFPIASAPQKSHRVEFVWFPDGRVPVGNNLPLRYLTTLEEQMCADGGR